MYSLERLESSNFAFSKNGPQLWIPAMSYALLLCEPESLSLALLLLVQQREDEARTLLEPLASGVPSQISS